MEWIAENWFLLLLLGGCLGMHLFMHGRGHGGHGHHHMHNSQHNQQNETVEKTPAVVPVNDESERISE